jgi:RNA polymerase sigma-70 factor (ECF subfamily)
MSEKQPPPAPTSAETDFLVPGQFFVSCITAFRDITAMDANFSQDTELTRKCMERAASGDNESWRKLLRCYHDRLRRMVDLRLDPRLQGRVDASDVLQDAYLEASERLSECLQQTELPFFLWLRSIVGTRLSKTHRHHLGTQMRDARRDVSIYRGALPEASSVALASKLLGRECRPSEAALRVELQMRLQDALNRMHSLDREALALRHFEQLSAAEAARVMGISEGAAGKRYLRALTRLKEIIAQMPGSFGGYRS